MPLTLIEGTYRVIGAAPDGDSMKFYPKRKADWALIGNPNPVRANQSGGAQLRLDGVDALETHYSPPGGGAIGTVHQPPDLAHAAAQAALEWLGFSAVKRDPSEIVTAASPSEVEGYILTRFADKYGRPVAFGFRGPAPKKSGESVYLDEALLKQSLNWHMLLEGQAYPTYYSKLYPDIRRSMTSAVQAARSSGKGLWPQDLTSTGFEVGALDEVQAQAVIMPKLFRRLLEYFAFNAGDTSLTGFKEYLAAHGDTLYILPEGHRTGFDYVVKVERQSVKLERPVEALIFDEK
ncbi:MAG TPA: hypothetical protein VNN80_18040 [Polyangiaceae bacterium]|jgi:endonuclease YncB( thermonuclease family)|nr:hypothetical protein [Polyangiaceae bacterium]